MRESRRSQGGRDAPMKRINGRAEGARPRVGGVDDLVRRRRRRRAARLGRRHLALRAPHLGGRHVLVPLHGLAIAKGLREGRLRFLHRLGTLPSRALHRALRPAQPLGHVAPARLRCRELLERSLEHTIQALRRLDFRLQWPQLVPQHNLPRSCQPQLALIVLDGGRVGGGQSGLARGRLHERLLGLGEAQPP